MRGHGLPQIYSIFFYFLVIIYSIFYTDQLLHFPFYHPQQIRFPILKSQLIWISICFFGQLIWISMYIDFHHVTHFVVEITSCVNNNIIIADIFLMFIAFLVFSFCFLLSHFFDKPFFISFFFPV